MSDKKAPAPATYKQPSKQAARTKALTHAVDLLTKRRQQCAIVPHAYLAEVKSGMMKPDKHEDYPQAAEKLTSETIESWETFRASSISRREPGDLTVAYLAGPEPTNDIETLMALGVRPENIWAFESDKDVFGSALDDVKRSKLRGVKLMKVKVEHYFSGTPRRFDIIYFDACGPLPSREQNTTRALANIFRHSALAPLGVLITNFSMPDISEEEALSNHAQLVAAYLYPKGFLDRFKKSGRTITDGAEAHGYFLGPIEPLSGDSSDEDSDWLPPADEIFQKHISDNFADYYGSFITRHISDVASIIAPAVRLLNSELRRTIVADETEALGWGKKLVTLSEDTWEKDQADAPVGTYSAGPSSVFSMTSMSSLLYTVGACGLLGASENFPKLPASMSKFLTSWAEQLTGTPPAAMKALDAIACFYALRHNDAFWAEALKEIAKFDYAKKMPFLCDVATTDLAFYPAFAQVAYPMHNNVSETKRYKYVAEGKNTSMYLDVLPFDECRYVYDWLSAAPLIDADWMVMSRQLAFRFALDKIAKNNRYYQDDYLYGCHAIGIEAGYFDAPQYSLRETIVSAP